MTRFKYSISKFWFNLNTRFQNSDSNRVLTSRELDSTSMTQLDAVSLCEKDRRNYSCIHHKIDIKNYWKLDDHVSKDDSTNRKQKLIKIKVKDCKWRCFINYQSLDRDAKNKTWVLRIQNQIHNHDVIINSLFYETHKKHQLKHAKTIELIKTNCLSKLIYWASERVLENIFKNNDQKFHLFKKQYYNLISFITRFKEKIIMKLL